MDMYYKKMPKKIGYPEIDSIFASWMRGKNLRETKTKQGT